MMDRLAKAVDRGSIGAISLIVLRRSAGGEFAVALALVAAEGADALHVAQQQRLGAGKIGLVDAERLQDFGQFIRGMGSQADQLIEIITRNPQIAGDTVEIGTCPSGGFR